MTEEHDYRLPRAVVPRRYELTLAPDLGAATFEGEGAIAVVFPLSDAASLFTGQTLNPNAGGYMP